MEEFDKIIKLITNKKSLIENIFYKYCILKKYNKDLHINLSNKYIEKIQKKDKSILEYSEKIKKKLILENDEERIINLIIKYFKVINLEKKINTKINHKKKTLKLKNKEKKNNNISISDSISDNNIIDNKKSPKNNLKNSSVINYSNEMSDIIYSENDIDISTISSYGQTSDKLSVCNKNQYIPTNKNNKIFITKDDLINNFGNKINNDDFNLNVKQSKIKNKEFIEKNITEKEITQNIEIIQNFDGIKIKSKGVIRI